MLKCAVFDMDGVIVNTEPLHVEEVTKIFKKFNLSVSQEEHYSYCGSSMSNMWKMVKKRHNFNELSVEDLCALHRNQIKDRLIDEKSLEPSDGLIELIQDLRKNHVKIALASSSPKDIVKIILNKFNIEKLFDYVISGDMVKKSKPDPEIFLEAITHFHIKNSESIVFEDSLNGIKAGKNANMKVIGYQKYTLNAEGMILADLVIDDFSEVNFEKLNNLVKIN